MQLNNYLEQSRTNHYKMLVIVDNNHQHEKIINALSDQGWSSYDVNENIIKIIENIPEEKVRLRISSKIKEWVNTLPDQAAPKLLL